MKHHLFWQSGVALLGLILIVVFVNLRSPKQQQEVATTSIATSTLSTNHPMYVEAAVGLPQFINPLLVEYNRIDRDLVALLFNGLTTLGRDGTLQPDLATSWAISEDGLSYTFRLRRDVQWHDGQPFTADDVLFTLSLLKSTEFPGATYRNLLWRQIIVEKIDSYTIRFSSADPVPELLDSTTVGILPAHRLTGVSAESLLTHPFNLEPIGTGPFKLETINRQFARLSVNPLYYGPLPKLTTLEFRFYPTYQEVLAAYQDKEILGSSIPPQAIPLTREITDLNLYNGQLSGYTIVFLNLQDEENLPFFRDKDVRQALLYSLDRPAIIDTVLNGQGVPTSGPILPWSWAYNPAQTEIAFDAERAEVLLTRVGWAVNEADGLRYRDGQPLSFTLLVSSDPTKIEVANAMVQQWQQQHIAAQVQIVGPELGDRLRRGDYQAALVELSFFGDPDPYPWWHLTQTEGGQNFSGWVHRRASLLLEQARLETNLGQRSDLYFEFQRIFADEIPSLILYYPVYTYGVDQRVKGVQLAPMVTPSDRFHNIADWFIVDRP